MELYRLGLVPPADQVGQTVTIDIRRDHELRAGAVLRHGIKLEGGEKASRLLASELRIVLNHAPGSSGGDGRVGKLALQKGESAAAADAGLFHDVLND